MERGSRRQITPRNKLASIRWTPQWRSDRRNRSVDKFVAANHRPYREAPLGPNRRVPERAAASLKYGFSQQGSAMDDPGSPRETQVDWRTSEGHQRLLLSFTFPNSAEGVPKWVDWDRLLGESLDSALNRLKAAGALLPVNEPIGHILYQRGANELKKMCREHGLKVSGTKEQMAERLANIDPSGLVLGYPGELLKCSHEAEQIANARRDAWKQSQLDDPDLKHIFDRQEFEAEKDRLKHRFVSKGHPEPSDDDVKWGMLNRRALQHATEGNLGLCRNMYLVMAKFLSRREKLKDSLRLYLIVCAYDLNGAQNRGGVPSEMLREFPLFDPTMADLAPAVVENVRDLAEDLKFSTGDVRELYLKSTSPMHFPLAPGKTWSVLSLAIEGRIDLHDQPECFKRIRSLLV